MCKVWRNSCVWISKEILSHIVLAAETSVFMNSLLSKIHSSLCEHTHFWPGSASRRGKSNCDYWNFNKSNEHLLQSFKSWCQLRFFEIHLLCFLSVLHTINAFFFWLIKYTCGLSREKKNPYDDVYEVQLSLPFYFNWFSSAFK